MSDNMAGDRSRRSGGSPGVASLLTRESLTERLRRSLERRDVPRLKMTLVVLATAAAGFLVSFLMLHAGVVSMPWRYLWAILSAYLVFLGLLAVWLFGGRTDIDIPDPPGVNSGGGSGGGHGTCDVPAEGHGGQFGGGGASAQFSDNGGGHTMPTPMSSTGSSGKFDFSLDIDELWVLIAVIAAVAAALIASVWVIYEAPTLMAELLLDGVVAAGLYRRLRRVERRYWLSTAVRRTVLPFAVVTCLYVLAGWGMQSYAPEAKSAGEVWRHYQSQH